MKVTTGYDFQGYVIVDYIDVLFEEMVFGLGFGKSVVSSIENKLSSLTGTEAVEMINKLNNVKKLLRERVEKAAEDAGANALIGIDYERSIVGSLIMVSMTATAVRIEKLANYNPDTVESQQRNRQKELEERKRQKELEERKMQKELEEIRKKKIELFEFQYDEKDPIRFALWKCMGCKKYYDMKEVWDSLISEESELGNSIRKEIEKRAIIERLYGCGLEDIESFIRSYLDVL